MSPRSIMTPADAERAAYDALARLGVYVAPQTRQAYLGAMQILAAETAEGAALENIEALLESLDQPVTDHPGAAE